jgi:putative endonuclease
MVQLRSRNSTREVGIEAEDLACRLLERQGLGLIARNYRCRLGEIDLIMQDGNTLVFIEVRYRRNPAFGSGAETITPKKQGKIAKAAVAYLQENRCYANSAVRFDVVSLSSDLRDDNADWIRDAFQPL